MTPEGNVGAAGPAHTSRCYWDFTEARWVCRSALTVDGRPGEPCTASPPLTAAPVAAPLAAPLLPPEPEVALS